MHVVAVPPVGLRLTVPEPLPDVTTSTISVMAVNVAVTFWAWFMVAVHEARPGGKQLLLQPAKLEPVAGVAVSVTVAPGAKPLEQVEPQSIPAGLDVTLPEPVPAGVTVSVAPVSGRSAIGRCVVAPARPGDAAPASRAVRQSTSTSARHQPANSAFLNPLLVTRCKASDIAERASFSQVGA